MKPSVSYIVASYNHEQFIEQTINSILAQDFDDLELIILDDGSTDDTPDIAERIARSDSRVSVYRQKNSGVVAARNRAISLSTGEYISIVDSDDIVPPDRTRIMVEALGRDPGVAMVFGDSLLIDDGGKTMGRFFELYPPKKGKFSEELFANYCFVPANAVMFRRNAFERSGDFWGPPHNTDYLKWIELGLVGEAILLEEHKLGCWRIHGANASQVSSRAQASIYDSLRKGLEELLNRHPEFRERVGKHRISRRYSQCYFMSGFFAGLEGEWMLARQEFRRAFAQNPSVSNAGGWISTLTGINVFCAPVYRTIARQKLGRLRIGR
jgi:glycosyltransferase involved in cell wall biosynthesis